MTTKFAAVLGAVALATASADEFCGQWDTAVAGDYIVYNNLWGMEKASSGSQCTGLDGLTGSTLSWHTHFSWAGGQYQVKSYANAALQFPITQLSAISSIPTAVNFTYTSDGDLIANAAYDLFTSATGNKSHADYEVMVWLANPGGAWPLTTTGDVPIATLNVNDVDFKLFNGPNGNTSVYSFVAAETTTEFAADLTTFVDYLVDHQGFPNDQYLTTVQFGTEPFSGTNANLTVSAYSISVQ